ncbi:MAG TPA: valine--tRNA ligase [Terriglobia bacterium]|nr:valine--tRNA ligase [Terriglobia bacterium]
MQREIPTVYSPESIEPRWARYWVEEKLYRPSDAAATSGSRFSLSLPPPNITGSLHMGHMLEHTEIDILMRWHRMCGENVLWLPGMDHASISTQMIVERELGREALPDLVGPQARRTWQREGQRRRLEMGPEKFLDRCWQWKEQNGDTIRRQMERLGASVDWTRARFTMDPAYSRAVIEVFVRLHEEGLIYRGQYIVNWCPRCGTAVSDLEVAHEDRPGHLWYIRYPFEDGKDYITVATTRPETMLGDTAVAVNPADNRYREMIGRKVVLPLMNRAIPVIGDEFVDPQFGTGAVKVTPAHDPNDFAIGMRHDLPRVTVIDFEAQMTREAGPYAGLSREKAREAVVRDLSAAGLLEKTEDYKLSVSICERCKTIVEPLLSMQWFLKMQPLATAAIRAVEDGRIRVVPENSRKIYLDWMYRIHDWCISRQLWWGHRIPAWHCEACNEIVVSREAPKSCPKCQGSALRQDPDVLDTWFSSGLWPFATLGWPEQTEDLKRFYPNDLMIMGFDILFFWAARMIMLGLKFTSDVPFRELYIHALVRDAERQKMSKTKGNVIDPIEITEKYGTDAVRFALASSAAPGTDIAFSDDKVQSHRNFANKIWNAARFILMNFANMTDPALRHLAAALKPVPIVGFDAVPSRDSGLGARGSREFGNEELRTDEPRTEKLLVDHWMFSRLADVTRDMNESLAKYHFHEAAYTIYHFFWHEFCDWYLEWVKPEITRPPEELARRTKASAAAINLARVFEAALHLLHPFMPFITEELWHQLPRAGDQRSISLTGFALVNPRAADPVSEKQFETIQEVIVAARNIKAEMGLHKEKPSAQVASEDTRLLELFRAHQEPILRLAGLEAMNFVRGRLPADASPMPLTSGCDLRLFYERAIEPAAERARLEREAAKLKQQLEQAERQLANESFRSRAPHDVVAGVERRRAELANQSQRIAESLARLGGSTGSATQG